MTLKEAFQEKTEATRRFLFLKTAAFVLIGLAIMCVVHAVMVDRAAGSISFQCYRSFYNEKRDTLDAVYIGSSSTYSVWLGPLAWERYGIAVSPFTCPSQPFTAAEYLIREARKTQPDALYIVPIRPTEDLSSTKLHYLVDNMPLSENKLRLVRELGGQMGLSEEEQTEYLFPFYRYHNRWSSMAKRDFVPLTDGLNGSSHYPAFLRTSTDVSSSYRATTRRDELPGTLRDALDSLLDYCAEEQVSVLFVETAGLKSKHNVAMVNSMRDIVEARGYPVVSLRPITGDVVDLDMTKDYYNAGHTNIHGAIKVTDYLSSYLVENFGFEDKRGDPVYRSWDWAYTLYTKLYASAYTLDVEWEGEPRDRALAAPVAAAAGLEGTITVSWDAVPGADGYRVYRKNAVWSGWQPVDTVEADILSLDDPGRKAGRTYYYAVIAYREEDGVRYWGEYDFAGVTGKTLSH